MNEFRHQVKNYLVLNEGIRFFKNSKRMFKLASKIESTEQGDRAVSSKIRNVAQDMDSLEKEFTIAAKENKLKIKMKYSRLSIAYSELINMINDESILKGLKSAGVLTAVVAATLAGYYYIATNGDIVMKGVADETERRWGVRPNDEVLKSVKAQIEKDGPVDYVKSLKKQGEALSNPDTGFRYLDDLSSQTGASLISAGENMGNLAKVTAAVTGGGIIGLFGLTKAFHILLGFKKAKKVKMYNKTLEVLNKIEKLD